MIFRNILDFDSAHPHGQPKKYDPSDNIIRLYSIQALLATTAEHNNLAVGRSFFMFCMTDRYNLVSAHSRAFPRGGEQ
ncbi:MAG: hypothetical protein AMJ65_16950 [Phycisphaerae bacterium SG8_4]|nr:MAG: hypothetical protein AMJ65_16950 [Phycisphaerae bacterium SG8_4]